MRGAGRAIVWEFWQHHRLGLIVLAIYIAGFVAIKRLVLPDAVLRVAPPNGLAGFLIGPISIAWFYFLAVFTYGLSGDLAARESVFPKRMFTLPVGNMALAGWPMLYGTTACASLWILTLLIGRWSGGIGIDLPWIWPALLAAVFTAWLQALTWLSYPLRGLRVVVAVLLLTGIDAAVILSIVFRASEATMIAILAPQLVVAFFVAWHAVARARRGSVPDWQGTFGSLGAETRRQAQFRSAARAQAWLEWRRHGRTLPALAALVLPWVLLLLFIPSHDNAPIVFAILLLALIALPAMAALAAPALGTFTTYAATRPMSSAALVGAKLRMTMWSVAAAWFLALLLIVAALQLSGRMDVVVERMQAFAEVSGGMRATAVVLLVLAALVLSTWKNLVMSLAVGLTNRPWIVKSSALAMLLLITVAFPFVYALLFNDRVQGWAWDYLPWILAALVCAKACAAAWVAVRLHGEGVLGDRALLAAAVGWLTGVAAVYALLAWLAALPIAPFYFFAALAILAVPWVRLGAAPLALALSRHR